MWIITTTDPDAVKTAHPGRQLYPTGDKFMLMERPNGDTQNVVVVLRSGESLYVSPVFLIIYVCSTAGFQITDLFNFCSFYFIFWAGSCLRGPHIQCLRSAIVWLSAECSFLLLPWPLQDAHFFGSMCIRSFVVGLARQQICYTFWVSIGCLNVIGIVLVARMV